MLLHVKVSLAINPAALLPGAAPPSSQPDSVAASFDTKPVLSNALQSVTKVGVSTTFISNKFGPVDLSSPTCQENPTSALQNMQGIILEKYVFELFCLMLAK